MEEIVPKRQYFAVCTALLALTCATIAVAYVPLGPFSTAVAMAIASLKALMVVVFFMHVDRRSLLVIVHASAAVLMLAILILLCIVDLKTR